MEMRNDSSKMKLLCIGSMFILAANLIRVVNFEFFPEELIHFISGMGTGLILTAAFFLIVSPRTCSRIKSWKKSIANLLLHRSL